MKLKLQFWKTSKVLAVTILEHEGLPITKNDSNIWIDNGNTIRLYSDTLMIGNCSDTVGCVAYTYTENAREYIDNIVNAITNELFVSKKQKIKVGDIVKVGDHGTTQYRVLHVLPENCYYRYVIANENNVRNDLKLITCIVENIIPVTGQVKFSKEITNALETYTWEM